MNFHLGFIYGYILFVQTRITCCPYIDIIWSCFLPDVIWNNILYGGDGIKMKIMLNQILIGKLRTIHEASYKNEITSIILLVQIILFW